MKFDLKKLNIREAFKDRKFKYGGMATLLVAIVIVAVLCVNLLFSLIPYKLDITSSKRYSISNKTEGILARIDKTINIYGLYELGNEDLSVRELALRYDNYSDKINFDVVDPIANPNFVNQFMTDANNSSTKPAVGSVIVQCPETGKFKVLADNQLYQREYDSETLEVTSEYLNAEQAITNAIVAVTAQREYKVALLDGHGELSLPSEVTSVMSSTFYSTYSLNLKSEGSVPLETDVIVVMQPNFDIDENEKEILLDYLKANGSIIFLMGRATGATPNFDAVLKYYGVTLGRETIYETDPNYTYAARDYALRPEYVFQTGLTQNLYYTGYKLLLLKASPIYADSDLRSTISILDIARTSQNAFVSNRVISAPFKKEEGEKSGTFVPVLAVEDKTNVMNESKEYSTRLCIVNCADFMLSTSADVNTYGNDDLFYNMLSYCLGYENMVTILPKSNVASTHNMSTLGIYLFAIFTGIVIPGGILAGGLTVYLKRRHL